MVVTTNRQPCKLPIISISPYYDDLSYLAKLVRKVNVENDLEDYPNST